MRVSVISYNSCPDRHCPKCQASSRAKWLAARQREVLPVPYFHVVFTLPQQIGGLALQNARVIYTLLFRAVSETLSRCGDPLRLGAAIGFLAVLHTWGQNRIFIHTCTVLCPAAASHRTARAGSVAESRHSFSL